MTVVVQTTREPRATLDATLVSCARAGIAPRIARQDAPSVVEHLASVLESAPPGGHLVRLEDDVAVSRNLLGNLRAWSQWGQRVAGFLYHCPAAPGNLRGRATLRPPKPNGDTLWWPFGTYLYGACGLFLRSDVAHELAAELRRIVADPPPLCWSRKAGRLMQDQSLCEAAARLEIPIVGHWPPLVEHLGGAASTWRGTPYPEGTGTTNGLWREDWRASGVP